MPSVKQPLVRLSAPIQQACTSLNVICWLYTQPEIDWIKPLPAQWGVGLIWPLTQQSIGPVFGGNTVFLPGSRWDGQSRNQNLMPGRVDYKKQVGNKAEAENTLSHSALKQHGLAFMLSHRPHTRNADTCMQRFPDIICPAFCSASTPLTSCPRLPCLHPNG